MSLGGGGLFAAGGGAHCLGDRCVAGGGLGSRGGVFGCIGQKRQNAGHQAHLGFPLPLASGHCRLKESGECGAPPAVQFLRQRNLPNHSVLPPLSVAINSGRISPPLRPQRSASTRPPEKHSRPEKTSAAAFPAQHCQSDRRRMSVRRAA